MSSTRHESTSKILLEKFQQLLTGVKMTTSQTTQPIIRTIPVTTKINYDLLMQNKAEKISTGNYAKIYKGLWNGEAVALKIIPLNHTRKMTDEEIENEKKILKNLSDLNAPNIVKLIGYAKETNYYCIVMEYIPFSLEDHITDREPFEWSRRYKVMWGMANGVNFLHQHKFAHRDIKSANILIKKENDEAVICDFGLAEDATHPSFECSGTAKWAAPEVLTYTIKDPLMADVFSMGTTLWQIAAWDMPFKEWVTFQFIYAMSKERLREKIPEDCPPKIADLIHLTWMQDPAKRPTARDVLVKIEEAAALKR